VAVAELRGALGDDAKEPLTSDGANLVTNPRRMRSRSHS
jgi:hypothetical protein